jgi:hypothetical protein
MTIPLFLASLQLGSVVPSQHVIVFGKGDSVVLHPPASAPLPEAPAKAAFFRAFKADLEHPAVFDATVELTSFPQWGRLVPGASGGIQFHHSFRGGLVVKIALEGLLQDHEYILTLNGNSERAGNANLIDSVPGNEQEKYFDFQTVTTDARGSYLAIYGIELPPGAYDVRFYVKDTVDFKIVLYHDFFRFEVD